MATTPVILIVNTSHGQLGDTTRKTGLWLEELAAPYYIFKDGGATVTVASISGGEIPLDPKSESLIVATSSTKKFYKDAEAKAHLENAAPIDSLNAVNFDGILLTGGHGAMWDFAENQVLKQLLEDFNRQHKLIAAVCHGVAGLLSTLDAQGQLLIKGRNLTSFSNSEEEASGLTAVVPFLLESRLTQLGAIYTKGALYTSHTVTDGNLITGQNQSSAGEVAKKMLISVKQTAGQPQYSLN